MNHRTLRGRRFKATSFVDEDSEPLTVDEIAEQIDRERSTASRSVQRLLKAEFIQKEQVSYEQGGYFHVYRPRDAEKIAQDMERTLNDWCAKMGQLIGEFSEKYDGQTDQPTAVER